MLITINGVDLEVAEEVSVQRLLEIKNIPEKSVIIELNGEIIKRENWQSRKLGPQDKIEIIRIIGGG